ncbi:glycosyltransferase family 1 protein [Candidatus Gracilibacteria bacterium]|nr:glycosyltransferase family 1 protein [Candidatus Gracilibacteria bacterium]
MISSPIADVIATYSGIVDIVEGVDAWIAAIAQRLQEPVAARQERIARAQPLLAASTWDAVAAQMARLIDNQLAAGPRARGKYML